MKVLPALAMFAMVVLVAACGAKEQAAKVTTPVPPPAELQKIDVVKGTGEGVSQGQRAVVHYTGWLYDPNQPNNKGSQFDTSVNGQPYSFVLGAGAVIRGWDQGLVGLKVGGVRQLVIPPDLAYGAAGRGPIPPNATLLFEVELMAVAD